MLTRDATAIWNTLKGIICVYKPPDVTCNRVRKTIMYKISAELNELDCRPPIDYVSIEGNPSKELTVIRKPSLADDPLVVGPRYQPNDIRCTWSSYLGSNTSGVLCKNLSTLKLTLQGVTFEVLGIQSGTKTAFRIRLNNLARAYRVKGLLGQATEDFYKDGKVVERSTFRFIKISHMERLLASMQAAHQRKMFELCGVELQSQTAYELAVQGPIRPSSSQIPLIYGIKCVHFEPPEFTIEVHCINEYEMYLKTLIHEIGVKLHSTAHCTGIQCIRHSYFNLEHALLRKHWTLQHITKNIEECEAIVKEHENLTLQQSIALQ